MKTPDQLNPLSRPVQASDQEGTPQQQQYLTDSLGYSNSTLSPESKRALEEVTEGTRKKLFEK